jgi:hypothetical protein
MFFPNKLEINSAFAEASRALSVKALLTPIDELKTERITNRSLANWANSAGDCLLTTSAKFFRSAKTEALLEPPNTFMIIYSSPDLQ